MSEKVYSIASPSICTKEKSHVVVVGSGPDRNEKVYSFSITPANTENKNDVDYPICIAPYARYKAVKEDNAGVTATKVKAKGILTDVVENALRQIEVEVYISNTTDVELNRNINVANIEMQHSQRMDSVSVQLISAEESPQHRRIFDINHIEGVESEKTNEIEAMVHASDETNRKTNEYKAAPIIQQDLLKGKLREFAAGVEVLPEWVNVARIVYGEGFYNDLMADRVTKDYETVSIHDEASNIVTRELQATHAEVILSTDVPNIFPTSIAEKETGDIQRKEILLHTPAQFEIGKKEREVKGIIEEFDLFNGMGMPVYLPEFDLFGRVRKELETRISLLNDSSKSLNVMQMQLNQTIESEKVIKEHVTTVIEEVASDIVPVTLDAEQIALDISYKQTTQQALITEQEAFTGIREFDGGIIFDITPADKDVITTDTDVIETVDTTRESEQYAIVSEYELLERQDVVEAATNEVDTFDDREYELESVTEEYERFERKPERESVLEDTEQFKLERVLDTEKPDELIVIEKENDDPKLWLRHSRQSWWTNSNWKKTR
ncbi:hypothetical protein ACFMB7_09590 [Bacillus toyonensis]